MATATSSFPPSSTNVLGALTFTLYVFSALVLTAYISISLLRTYNTIISRPSVQHARIQLFAALATISFATLSYNMLLFLVNSYRDWAMQQQPHPIPLPRGGSGVGERVVEAWRVLDIWQWLKSSMLFDDFAHEAFGSQARSWWTTNALCVSIHWAVTLSIEGKKRDIPRLWAYAAIAQILPVSFAQNLLYLAILLSAPSSPSALSKSSDCSSPLEKPSSSPRTPPASNTKRETLGQIVPFLLYYILVALAPSVATSSQHASLLLLLVGVIRLLLLAPLFFLPLAETPDVITTSKPVAKTIIVTGSAVLFAYRSFVALRENGGDVGSVVEAVRDHPAVAALGWDWLFCLGSYGAWGWTGGGAEI